ncbi:MAG: DUF2970 domain-containing protein, partial [Gammaproteobacteria bacterium]|nr:DUF2970 domain-containing protein [Gammaproteobacteria bacterium]
MDEHRDKPTQGESEPESLGIWKVVKSVLAAGFGVQSSRNRSRDFAKGKPVHFIAVGIVLTVAFVTAIIALVNL